MRREWLKMCELSAAGIHQQPRRPAARRRHHASLRRARTTASSKTFNQKGQSPHLVPHEKEAVGPRCAPWQLDKRAAQIGLSTTLRGHWRGGLWYNLHFLAGNWSFGDAVDGDVSCRGLIKPPCLYHQHWWMFIVSSKQGLHVTSRRSWFEPLNECHRGKLL